MDAGQERFNATMDAIVACVFGAGCGMLLLLLGAQPWACVLLTGIWTAYIGRHNP